METACFCEALTSTDESTRRQNPEEQIHEISYFYKKAYFLINEDEIYCWKF
jgi:hypothetical protein